MAIRIGLLMFLCLLSAPVSAQIALERVLRDCENKTIVTGRDENGEIVPVGETMSGYCEGFLEGVFAVLLHNKTICEINDQRQSPEFLLSVVLMYRQQSATPDGDAIAVLEKAFKRAFICDN